MSHIDLWFELMNKFPTKHRTQKVVWSPLLNEPRRPIRKDYPSPGPAPKP